MRAPSDQSIKMKKNFQIKIIFSIFFQFIFFSSISAQEIYITKLNDLSFGEVFIGYSADIQDTDMNAAKFSFFHTNKRKKNLSIRFVLPTTLDNGSSQIPITFDKSQASWSSNDQQSGRKNFDPHGKLKIRRVKKNETHFIWLGGSITTTTDLPYGVYTGTIILTVLY